MTPSETAPPEATPPMSAPESSPDTAAPGDEVGSADPPVPDELAPKRSGIPGALDPAGLMLTLLLVPRRLRKSASRDTILDRASDFPELRLLERAGAFDLLADLNHIVIGTSVEGDARQTFAAFDYTMSRADLRSRLGVVAESSGQRIEWQETSGAFVGSLVPLDGSTDADPRQFVVRPGKKVVVYAHPEYVTHLVGDDAVAADTTIGYIRASMELRRLAKAAPKASMRFVADGMSGAPVNMPPDPPVAAPKKLELAFQLRKEASGDASLRMQFDGAESAKSFERFWKKVLPRQIEENPTLRLTLGVIVDGASIKRAGNAVTVRVHLAKDRADLVLITLGSMLIKLRRPRPSAR